MLRHCLLAPGLHLQKRMRHMLMYTVSRTQKNRVLHIQYVAQRQQQSQQGTRRGGGAPLAALRNCCIKPQTAKQT
jgi:hypothetical protein